MDKNNSNILSQYADARARVVYLRRQIKGLEDKLHSMTHAEGGIVADTVSVGKRGKKSLGSVKATGFRDREYSSTKSSLEARKLLLRAREDELLALMAQAEEYIESVESLEVRNILSLHYIEGLTWVQVAKRMNDLYRRGSYTPDGCRIKHNRFLKKN